MNLISYLMKAQFNLEPNPRDNQTYQEILLTSKTISQDKENVQKPGAFKVVDLIMLMLQMRTTSNTIEIIG